MYKKVVLGVFALIFSVMAAGAVAQLTSASIGTDTVSIISADGDTVPTKTPVVGGTIPTNTPAVGDTIPTRTPVADPGTIPTRTPNPGGGCIVLAHFNDFDAGEANIYVRLGGLELTELAYGDVTDCLNVPPGAFRLEVIALDEARAPEDTLIAFADVSISAGAEYTAILTGDGGANQASGISFVINSTTAPGPNKARVRVVHAAPIDSVPFNTRVDLRDNGSGVVIGGVSNLTFGGVSGVFEVDANVANDWYVSAAGSAGSLIDLAPFTLLSGEEITVYINGGGANRPVSAEILTNVESDYLPIIFRDYDTP